jgi:hypothetical protein
MALVSVPVNVQPPGIGGCPGPRPDRPSGGNMTKLSSWQVGPSYTFGSGGYELVTAVNGCAFNTQLTSATIDSKVAPT